MSSTAPRESKKTRRTCESCRQRKARFRYRGVVKADRDHTLCFECFRSARDSGRAQALSGSPSHRPFLTPPWTERRLTNREAEHRQTMFAHLAASVSAVHKGTLNAPVLSERSDSPAWCSMRRQ
jgi:hypothetical protein